MELPFNKDTIFAFNDFLDKSVNYRFNSLMVIVEIELILYDTKIVPKGQNTLCD